MIRLAFAIAFLSVFGLVSVWLISFLERKYWKKDSNTKKVNLNEQKTTEEKTN